MRKISMAADFFGSSQDRPTPSSPDLVALGLVMLAKVASDVAEITATMKRIEAAASKPARKPAPGGETLEETSRRVLERKFNPFLACGGDAMTSREDLCREFGIGMRLCNKLVEYWKEHGYAETKRGTGVRLFAQRRS
jgi:hypothetical protein